MSKVYILGANTSYDRSEHTVAVKQIVQMEGYDYGRYAVGEIERTSLGVRYHLIDLQSHEFRTTFMIRPLSQKFGIGYYYDDADPQFVSDTELLLLRSQAQEKKEQEEKQAEEEHQRQEQLRITGAEKLRKLIPAGAKAVIIASFRMNESDSQRDYFDYSVGRVVILGFSTHTKNNFDEMRRFARHFEETAHLAEKNPDFEHRENYTGGGGYYLGENRYSGWVIEKDTFSDPEHIFKRYALAAGEEQNICLPSTPVTGQTGTCEAVKGDFTIVRYSEKSVAVFGDTKPIKEKLSALGGRFNKYLTHNGERCTGWVFQKSKEPELRKLTGMNPVNVIE